MILNQQFIFHSRRESTAYHMIKWRKKNFLEKLVQHQKWHRSEPICLPFRYFFLINAEFIWTYYKVNKTWITQPYLECVCVDLEFISTCISLSYNHVCDEVFFSTGNKHKINRRKKNCTRMNCFKSLRFKIASFLLIIRSCYRLSVSIWLHQLRSVWRKSHYIEVNSFNRFSPAEVSISMETAIKPNLEIDLRCHAYAYSCRTFYENGILSSM